MEHTERGDNPEILETAGEAAEEGQQEIKDVERKHKKKRNRKNRSGLKAMLLILQHAALAIMVLP